MKTFNKRGELIGLAVIMLIVVIGGIISYQSKNSQAVVYLGDNLTKIAYNLKSQNSYCNLANIMVEQSNILVFQSAEEARKNGFRIDSSCK